MKITFPTFKKLALGGPKPKLKGIQISSYAEEILSKVIYQKRKEYAELVVVKVGDMGLSETDSTTSQIFAWAKENGLELCPAEVGPRLREVHTDQPQDEWLVIGMEPLLDSDGCPRVFRVDRGGGGPWLGSAWAGPEGPWDAGYRFVFRKSQSSDLENSALHSDTLHLELPDVLEINGIKYKKL